MNDNHTMIQKLKYADAIIVSASNGFSISEGLNIFANDEKFLTLSQYDASSKLFLDIDTSEYKELTIGGKPAVYHKDEERCSKTLLVLEGEWTVEINSEGDEELTYDKMKELAENLIFIK